MSCFADSNFKISTEFHCTASALVAKQNDHESYLICDVDFQPCIAILLFFFYDLYLEKIKEFSAYVFVNPVV